MRSLLFTSFFFLCFIARSSSQSFLITLGPTIAVPDILDYEVGIIGDLEPQSFVASPGYRLSISSFTGSGNLQLGVEVTNELINYGVYLPYQFPSDAAAQTISKLRLINKSFKLGIGGLARYKFNDYILGLNIAYDVSLTNKSDGYFDLGYTDEMEETWPYKQYTAGKGVSLGMHVHKEFNKIVIGISLNFKFYDQRYTDEVFLHDWKIRPVVMGVYFGYMLIPNSKGNIE